MRTIQPTIRAVAGGLLAVAVAFSLASPASAAGTAEARGRALAPSGAAPIAIEETGTLAIARPTISGTTRVGRLLRATAVSTGTVAPRVKMYTWLRDGAPIRKAHASTYRLTSKDRKHRISVRVAAFATGFPTVKRTSASTERIRFRVIDDPTNSQVVVNKQRSLKPKAYAPSGLILPSISNNGQRLRSVAAHALERMAAGAREDGVTITLLSGYRSYQTQVAVFNQQVATYGRAVAEKQSARPGYSEHQTGFSGDLGGAGGCPITSCFAGTQAGKWLKKYAYRYGFIMRYPDGYTKITGYAYEPWHYRYVGKKVATDMKRKGIKTLEQYRHLPAAPTY